MEGDLVYIIGIPIAIVFLVVLIKLALGSPKKNNGSNDFNIN